MDWDLRPGDFIKRTELHMRYGGGGQGGIAASRRSPNVLIFTDHAVGKEHGYFDHWDGELFHYCGEGQRGDQTIARGNRTILHHREDKRALRVFEGVRGTVRYLGEFEVDSAEPYYIASAPETGGGPARQVIMFRLRQID
jgi:hypothetical protein